MTPDDFLRAITPGVKQPDGLDLDAFRRFDPKVCRPLTTIAIILIIDCRWFFEQNMNE